MSELQQYYDEFRSGYWADPDATVCPCRGSGWCLSDVDTWHECPCHWTPGQRHPEDDSEPTPPQLARANAKRHRKGQLRLKALRAVDNDNDIPF